MRLLITRPEEDAAALRGKLEARGHEVLHAPLLEIRDFDNVVLPPERWQGILVTSANGARALSRHANAPNLRSLPVLSVGEGSARELRARGFAQIISADGDVQALAAHARLRFRPEDGPLLHAAGTVVAGDLGAMLASDGFHLYRAVLYEARAAHGFPSPVLAALEQRTLDGALFYSPRTARIFVEFAAEPAFAAALQYLTAYCLSAAVAAALGRLVFARVQAASSPNEAALLALLD